MGGRALVVTVLAFIALGIGWLFWARGRAMGRPTPAVVLLPFAAASPEAASFSDGLTIELIDSLAKVEKLKVVSWNRAAPFRGKAGQLRELREQLQAGSVVDGTVRKQGDRLHITVKLIDTNTGESIWSDTLDRPEREVFDIQERIAKGIVYALNVPMRIDPQRILVPPRTSSMPAYEDYLQARAWLGRFSRESLARSSEYAAKAIAADPKYGPAYALLAANYGLFEYPTHESIAKAKDLAGKAIQMNASSGEAHAALGMALGIGEWDWPGARLELERAVQWSPGSADAHAALALGYLLPTNDPDGAEYEVRKALELDPMSFYANYAAAEVLLSRNKLQDSLERFRAALAICGDFAEVHRDYSTALKAAGQTDLAAEELAKAGPATEGPLEDARRAAGSADLDAAFAALDKAIDQHDVGLSLIQSDTRLANLRKDARYRPVLKRLKLRE